MAIRVAAIYRYPVKGLSPEYLDRVVLTPGEGLPHDRRFAIAHATTRFDPANPEWLPKTNFIMLMRDEKIAELRTQFEAGTGLFKIEHQRRPELETRITEEAGRRAVGEFFAGFLRGSLTGTPRVVEAAGHTFSDAKRKPNAATAKYVSLVNLGSVTALEEVAGARVDPVRFRANLYVEGAPAWAELDWVGSEITVGQTRLHVVSPITRCAATQVNPDTAKRDLDVPALLESGFGHVHMGVYAEVLVGGEVVAGADVRV